MKLNDLDRRVILLLQQDGRASNTALSKRLGVSESTVRRRIGQLIRNGVISVIAVPEPSALDYKAEALIGLEVQLGSLDSVTQELASMPEVQYVASCTGRYDVFIWVILKSQDELVDFLKNKLAPISGIRRSETFVNLEVTKRAFGWLY